MLQQYNKKSVLRKYHRWNILLEYFSQKLQQWLIFNSLVKIKQFKIT